MTRQNITLDDIRPDIMPTGSIYTPTLVNGANVDSSTAYSLMWYRIKNFVTVVGQIAVDATATGAVATVNASLPVPHNLVASTDLQGLINDGTNGGGRIIGNVASGTADITFWPSAATNRLLSLIFVYKVQP